MAILTFVTIPPVTVIAESSCVSVAPAYEISISTMKTYSSFGFYNNSGNDFQCNFDLVDLLSYYLGHTEVLFLFEASVIYVSSFCK